MDELLKEFLVESNENLSQLDQEIVELEANPEDTEILKSIFRTIHTVKGSCGFLGLSRMEKVAHHAEDALGKMRDGVLAVIPETIDPVLKAIDIIQEILQVIEETQVEPDGDDSEIIEDLKRVLAGDFTVSESSPEASEPSPESAPQAPETPNQEAEQAPQPQAESPAEPVQEPEAPPPAPAPPEPQNATPPAPKAQSPAPAKKAQGASQPSVASKSIRVDISILDRLMNRVGELVLTRNQLSQLAQSDENSPYKLAILELNRVTTELQEAVMQTRMREIGNAWKRIPRILRDLCSSSGKQIDLEMIGADTELDRQVLDAIEDPLLHMVRNSADHGVEAPDIRKAAGKPEKGKITLNARHEGGFIVIEITDDGAGIDVFRVRQKAINQGLLDPSDVGVLSEEHILNFIFEPGFSTAQQVTSVSGRGVGMDVVKTRIQSIGGTVSLSTKMGQGTTVHIKIPLTLAIISALIVSSGHHSFAIPQVGVVELVRVSDENRHLIETVNGARAMRLRDKLLSLVRLSDVLGLDRPSDEVRNDEYVIIIQVEKREFGLIVDAVHDTEEIVVKPLGRYASNLNVYAGTTILGDGRVILILDTTGLANKSEILNLSEGKVNEAATKVEHTDIQLDRESVNLLLFHSNEGTRHALPLSLVSRLEEFDSKDIEQSAGRYLIQYRGHLMPLIPADSCYQVGSVDPQPVIVFSDADRVLGLAVHQISDIVQDRIEIEMKANLPGILGTAVIDGLATDVLDLHHFLRQTQQDWFATTQMKTKKHLDLLVVDDSDFFRNLLGPIIVGGGHKVVFAKDGQEALQILESNGNAFDAVLSDLDMPKLNGFELVKHIRQREDYSELPVIALTGHTSDASREKALESGFNNFITKIDKDAVLDAICELGNMSS